MSSMASSSSPMMKLIVVAALFFFLFSSYGIQISTSQNTNTCKVDFVFHSLTADYFGDEPLGDLHYRLLNSTTCTDYKDCAEKLQAALFYNENYAENNYYFPRDFQKSRDELKTMSSNIVARAVGAARHLIDRGATRVVIPGVFPLGCLPMYKTAFESYASSSSSPYDIAAAYDENKCLKHVNSLAKYHNEMLQQGIYNLAQEKPDAIVVYADYYNTFHFLMRLATYLGMETQKVCCGIGGRYNFDIKRVCGGADWDVPRCSNPDLYVNYNGFRLTEVAYNIMARRLHHNIFPKLQCGF